MTKKQHYMTWEERQKLEVLHNNMHLPVYVIAKTLGFSRQTIYNELRLGAYEHERNGFLCTRYSSDKAQQFHNYYQSAKGRPEKIGHDRAYADYLENKMLNDKFSPAAALVEARKDGYKTSVCVSTLYSYIYKGLFRHLTAADLWEKSKRKQNKAAAEKRVPHPKWPTISDRPASASLRSAFGHWEMDLVVGCKGSSAVLLTLTERKTRREMIFKLPNRKAATIRKVFDQLERKMGKLLFRDVFRTITTDNGSEFLQYDELRRSIFGGIRFDVYYCHSYCAWEKGTNENHNRMIRRWFPKGTDFGKVTRKQIAAVEYWMNNYPRRSLGWLTPLEAEEQARAA